MSLNKKTEYRRLLDMSAEVNPISISRLREKKGRSNAEICSQLRKILELVPRSELTVRITPRRWSFLLWAGSGLRATEGDAQNLVDHFGFRDGLRSFVPRSWVDSDAIGKAAKKYFC